MKQDYSEGIYNVRKLGWGKTIVLGLQHTFAMFGATVLVPLITGLNVSTTLLCAGLGTLLFHIITKGKMPAFLGSSFAFLGGFSIVAPKLADASGELTIPNTEMLPYACGGVVFAGLIYLVMSFLIRAFGVGRIMRYFPPVVTGPIIISIGLILAPTAITNCATNWPLAAVALIVVIVCNIWGKGMVKILPILLGVLVSYGVALVTGAVDFTAIANASWVGLPLHRAAMAKFDVSAILTIMTGKTGPSHGKDAKHMEQLLDARGLTEAQAIERYRSRNYPKPALTADIVIFRREQEHLRVLLVRRGGHPYLGKWALPGGFANENEPVEQTAARELQEETGVAGLPLELVGVFSQPGRDPRGWVVSAAFRSTVEGELPVRAGDDAADAAWFEIGQENGVRTLRSGSLLLTDADLAFDHSAILAAALR